MDKLTELSRLVENLIRGGTIAEVDPAGPRCRVKSGKLLTDWIPYFQTRAGEDKEWDPVSVGEQCLVFSPSGLTSAGVALCGLPSDAFPAPDTSLTRRRRRYRDGAVVDYDMATHTLSATLPAGGKANITAPGGLHVIGDVVVEGKVTVSVDVVAGPQNISLVGHKHGGIQPGSGTSGAPQP